MELFYGMLVMSYVIVKSYFVRSLVKPKKIEDATLLN